MMEWIQNGVGIALIVVGLAFMFVGSVGILRLPDFFSRTHAASKVDTTGIMVLLAGIAVIEGLTINTAKIGIAILLLLLTNPVAAHALARAARLHGHKPWQRPDAPPPERNA
ncbi:MAG TPA: monovalent cation/H(+) antiporter subunit G [Candidatus Synoicihabitans sp.]|nr:monovalent cation/H(+) antiporter subunit G [Candidatus Synoicihabitans sp.]